MNLKGCVSDRSCAILNNPAIPVLLLFQVVENIALPDLLRLRAAGFLSEIEPLLLGEAYIQKLDLPFREKG